MRITAYHVTTPVLSLVSWTVASPISKPSHIEGGLRARQFDTPPSYSPPSSPPPAPRRPQRPANYYQDIDPDDRVYPGRLDEVYPAYQGGYYDSPPDSPSSQDSTGEQYRGSPARYPGLPSTPSPLSTPAAGTGASGNPLYRDNRVRPAHPRYRNPGVSRTLDFGGPSRTSGDDLGKRTAALEPRATTSDPVTPPPSRLYSGGGAVPQQLSEASVILDHDGLIINIYSVATADADQYRTIHMFKQHYATEQLHAVGDHIAEALMMQPQNQAATDLFMATVQGEVISTANRPDVRGGDYLVYFHWKVIPRNTGDTSSVLRGLEQFFGVQRDNIRRE
ncbi:MAG: hypothetical protein M1825_001472 [Sarcosagium campestre]|nr:MAG: hypothetical protein M1825_001472 [Sarcosagium campestre]